MGTPASLPSFNTSDRILAQMQSQWGALIDPVLKNPLVQGRLVEDVVLTTGSNTVNHLLARNYQGWLIVDRNAAATVYSTPSTMPDKTLILVASAPITLKLWVF